MLGQWAADTGAVIVFPEYSLAPEHVWPRPYNDCIAAASWLVSNAKAEFGTDTLIIGGESAGGQLCALTCLGLRKALKLPSTAPFPYKAANLVYGCYDMGGTPSLHNYHKPKSSPKNRICRIYKDNRSMLGYGNKVPPGRQ